MEKIVRKEWSGLARTLSLIPLYLLLWPIFRLLELAGVWPQKILPRANTRFFVWPQDLEPGKGDVMVCSYFKSGTNWMLQIATQIAWRGRAEFDHIHDVVPWPEMPQRQPFAVAIDKVAPEDSPTGLRVIKTHYAPGVIPFTADAKYLCVIRDPKAVFVSSYHFIRDTNMGPLMPTPAHWLELFLSEGALFGPWARHAAACWALRNEPNVLFLTYEQLKEDLPGGIRSIAGFMEAGLNEEELAAVVARSEFGYMKGIGHKFDPLGIGPPWIDPKGVMIRKGEKRSSEELVPGANRRIDDSCRALLQELGSDLPYDRWYGGPAFRN